VNRGFPTPRTTFTGNLKLNCEVSLRKHHDFNEKRGIEVIWARHVYEKNWRTHLGPVSLGGKMRKENGRLGGIARDV